MVWWHLDEKKKEPKRSSSNTAWTAEVDEPRKGVQLVNQNAPEDDSENQHYLRILAIRRDSGSSIAGWPAGKVIRMAQNKARGTVEASSLTFFPFTAGSLKPFMGEFLILCLVT